MCLSFLLCGRMIRIFFASLRSSGSILFAAELCDLVSFLGKPDGLENFPEPTQATTGVMQHCGALCLSLWGKI